MYIIEITKIRQQEIINIQIRDLIFLIKNLFIDIFYTKLIYEFVPEVCQFAYLVSKSKKKTRIIDLLLFSPERKSTIGLFFVLN